jgi:hypothetical protein
MFPSQSSRFPWRVGIGVLLAGWCRRQTQLVHYIEEGLQLLADQAAQRLAHLRTYAEQERHLNESETLRRLRQSMSATLDLQNVLQLVTMEGARLLVANPV